MIITLKELVGLLPILVLGVTVVFVLLSIACGRNQLLHAVITIFGLCIAIVSLGVVLWWYHHRDLQDIFTLICIDSFAVLYMMLILVSSLSSSILAYKWLLRYPNDRRDEFYLLLLISSMGGVLLATTNHLAMLFVAIELISLPLFGLLGYSFFYKSSLEASIKYIVLSGMASSFLLLGMALVYAETGCLLFTEIEQVLLKMNSDWLYQPMLIIGVCVMLVGFGFKLSFVPFHLWTPDVYQGAPYPVSMYLSTSSKIAVISVLIRFFLIFPDQYNAIFHIFLSSTAFCSILFGNLMAIQQNSIKRILAYSSIAHTGYLLISLIALRTNSIALEAVGIYLISYLIASIGIFSMISIVSSEYSMNEDADSLSVYRGLFWKNPILSVVFTIIILSLAGMPMTLGFIGKFYLFVLGISNQLWFSVALIVMGSIVGIFYNLRIMMNLYLRPLKDNNMHYCEIDNSNWVSTPAGILAIISTCCILFLGIYPQPIIYCMNLMFL